MKEYKFLRTTGIMGFAILMLIGIFKEEWLTSIPINGILTLLLIVSFNNLWWGLFWTDKRKRIF